MHISYTNIISTVEGFQAIEIEKCKMDLNMLKDKIHDEMYVPYVCNIDYNSLCIFVSLYSIMQYQANTQNSENNNCKRHEVNDQFGSFQLQCCNHRQPI